MVGTAHALALRELVVDDTEAGVFNGHPHAYAVRQPCRLRSGAASWIEFGSRL